MLESSWRQKYRCLLLNKNAFLNLTTGTMFSHVKESMKHMVSTKIWFPCISLQDCVNIRSCSMYRNWASEHFCVWINAICSHEWWVSITKQMTDWKYMLIRYYWKLVLNISLRQCEWKNICIIEGCKWILILS